MDEDESASLGHRQDQMRADLERLNQYRAEIPEVWTGIKYDGGDVVVLLTEPDAYRQRLLALVEHPDRVRLEKSRYTRRHLDEVYRQTSELVDAPGRERPWRGRGPGLEHTDIDLHGTEAALATELHHRFGDAIQIRLGAHRFPLETSVQPPLRPAPVATLDIPDLVITAHPDQASYRPGEKIHGQVHLTTRGEQDLQLNTGSPAVGVLLDEHGQVTGVFVGAIGGVGRGLKITPGQDASVGFLAGSNTRDPRLGPLLPPGSYQLVVPLRIYLDEQPSRRATLVSAPTTIEIIDTQP